MEEFHWHRILEFVRAVAPFDALPRQDLERAVSAMEVEPVTKGLVLR